MRKNSKLLLTAFTAMLLTLCFGATAFASENHGEVPTSATNQASASEVLAPGVYDLGDGMSMTVAPVPPSITPFLNVSDSNMPLNAGTWSWFCYDDPWATSYVRVYNNKGPGNINICVKVNNAAQSEYTYYGLAPGYYVDIHRGLNPYNVWLSATVTGNYSVKVTD